MAQERVTILRLSKAAKRDLEETKNWYDEHAPGLADRFAQELDSLMLRIERFPKSHRIVYLDVRRAHLRSFPYSVLYHQRPAGWYVFAILHQARDPQAWRRRR